MPPTALVSESANEVGASLNTKLTVPVPLGTFTSVLLIDRQNSRRHRRRGLVVRSATVDDLLDGGGGEDGVALIRREGKAVGTMVSCPGPPAIWNAVPISCTVKVVPVALVLATVKPLTELCDRSSAASDVTSWSFVPLPLKLATPLATVLLIFSVRFVPSPDR